jgi:hypothetical protein
MHHHASFPYEMFGHDQGCEGQNARRRNYRSSNDHVLRRGLANELKEDEWRNGDGGSCFMGGLGLAPRRLRERPPSRLTLFLKIT